MRVVLDTNVLVRATAGPPGLAHELVLHVTRQEHVFLLSPFLISELGRVLRYERMRTVHGLDDARIDAYVTSLVWVAEMVILPSEPTAVVINDPDDDPVLATAVIGHADVLCTKDRHLLRPEIVGYCAARGIAVVSDLELLDRLTQAT